MQKYAAGAVIVLAVVLGPGSARAHAGMGVGGPAGSASLASLVLKQSDLPAGFHLGVAHYVVNAQDANDVHIAVAQLRSHGRINGYRARYQPSSRGPGALIIQSEVSSWKSTAGAHWGLDHGLANATTGGSSRITIIRVPRVGDEDTGLTYNTVTHGNSLTFYVVGFRHGAYLGGVVIAGFKGTVKVDDAVRYARIVNRRIQKKG